MKLKSLIWSLALLATALGFVQCTQTPADNSNSQTTLTLVPSFEECILTKDCAVTFRVFVGEQELTSDSTLEIWNKESDGNIVLLRENNFEIDEAGEYTFFAYCSYGSKILQSEEITVNVVDDATLYLRPSAQMAEVGAAVTFEAFCGIDNVTESSDLEIYIYNGNEATKIDGLSYTISELKDYKFYATCTFNGETIESQEQIVSGMEWSDKDFYKRTLIVQGTGTKCGYCPGAVATIHGYTDQAGDKEAILVAAHWYSQDIMNSDASYQLLFNLGAKGFPSIFVGGVDKNATEVDYMRVEVAVDDNGEQYGIPHLNSEKLASVVKGYAEQQAKTGIKISSTKATSTEVAIDAEVMVREEGEFGICAMVIEDGIYAEQARYDALDWIDLGDYDLNTHHNALMGAYPLNAKLYEELGKISKQSARSGYKLNCSIALDDMPALKKIENCSVVVYTIDLKSQTVDNIVKVKLGESLDYQYKN